MLIGSVTGINDRHGSNLACILCSSFQIVAHNNYVRIIAYHHNCILQRLSLGTTRHLWISKSYHTGSQAIGSSFKAEACTRTRLEEKRSHNLPLQETAVGILLKFTSHTYQILDFISGMIGQSHKTAILHNTVLLHNTCDNSRIQR